MMKLFTHRDMRTGGTYYTYDYAPTVGTSVLVGPAPARWTDLRTGRDHARPGKATARGIYGATLRMVRP